MIDHRSYRLLRKTVMISHVFTKFPLLNLMMFHHLAHIRDESSESDT